MKKLITAFLRNDDGATAVEYGLMVAAIAAVIVGTVILLGGEVHGGFTTVNNSLAALP